MILEYDYFKNVTPPDYILCKANGERIGIIPCTDKTFVQNFNAYDEITFSTYMYMDGKRNPYYDNIVLMIYLFIPKQPILNIKNAKL